MSSRQRLLWTVWKGWESPYGYACFLAVATAIFLLAVGFRADTLPIPPRLPASDAIVSHYPNALFLQRSVWSGAFPLWRQQLMSGQPFAANPLNKVWYPLMWLVVLMPAAMALNLQAWLHLVIGGVGMRAFARATGQQTTAANIVGLIYAFSPRLIATVGAGHLDVVGAMAWLPALLWSVANLTSSPLVLVKSPTRQGVWIGFLSALCFLADLRIFVLALALAGSYVVLQWCIRGVRRADIIGIAVGGTVLLLLTAVQWVPLIDLLPTLSRNGLTPTESSILALEPITMLTLLMPRPPGFHEVMLYTGVIVLLAALLGLRALWRQRHTRLVAWFAVAWIVFALWYALGLNGWLWSNLMTLFPALLWLRVPPRIWIVGALVIIWVAGYGLEYGVEALTYMGKRWTRSRRWLVAGSILALLFAELLWNNVAFILGLPASAWLAPAAPIAQALRADGVTRFYSPSFSLPQQVAAYYEIPDFGGIDPFQLKRYLPAFEAATGTRVRGYSVTLPSLDSTSPTPNGSASAMMDARQLASWNVSHVVAAYPLAVQGLSWSRTIDGVYIYRNTMPLAGPEHWSGPNCARDPFPTASLTLADGWVATTIDGAAYHCYAPPSQAVGLVLTGLGLAVGSILVVQRARPVQRASE